MKIGLTTFGADGGKSGISQYLIHLIREFSKLASDDRFEMFLYKNERSIFVPDDFQASLHASGDYLRSPILNIIWHQLVLPFKTSRNKIDVMFYPAGNRRLSFMTNCPSVGVVHDLSAIHVESKYDRFRTVYIKQVLPILIRRLDFVLTISESSRNDIIHYAGVPAERVVSIPLGVDLERFHPGGVTAENEKKLEACGIRKPYLFYVSRLEHPGKNHVRLIEAFTQIKQRLRIPHQLVLVGSRWSRADEIYRAAEKSAARSDILFTGFFPQDLIPDLFRSAALLIFPSLYEGFGLPVLEAMASGTPVACSNLSSLPEVTGDAGVLFDAYNIDDMSQKIESILLDRDMQQSLVEKGLQRSREFTWRSTAKRTLEVLHRIGGRKT